MSNITFHRHHMTAIPTDLLLNPTISIEAKAFAGIEKCSLTIQRAFWEQKAGAS